MPLWLRAILIIMLIGALLVAVAGVIGYRWWTNNKDHLLQQAKSAQADGAAFGQGKEVTACIDEGIRQVQECGGLPCEIKVRLFLDGCMTSASNTRDYCASIPPRSAFLKRAQWTLEECGRRNLTTDQRCNRVMQGVGGICDHETSK
jgi:hypothetical protein